MNEQSTYKADRHDPGGKRSFSLPEGVVGDAVFGGNDRCFRYVATYIDPIAYAVSPRTFMALGMNPSTASHDRFDPTVAKIWRLARRLGFSRLFMTNAYAYRSTDQRRLLKVPDPIGPDNDQCLMNTALDAEMILVCHGTPHHRSLQARGPAVVKMLRDDGHGHKLHVLKLSKSGVPCHPLYLPDSLVPVPWNG
ncbi:DUF1643 domain-containing protein [Acidiphilium angustum]|uniref:DUF1643 domain-containing protein n=1 Tax=Acidiphilium angustum TaxID=523 RepID=UPI00049431AA|nr:DUF1643 domain-containing protein [Acidiphilium angustum]